MAAASTSAASSAIGRATTEPRAAPTGTGASEASARPRWLVFAVVGTFAVLASTAYELLVRQPGAYLPEPSTARSLARAAPVVGAALGLGVFAAARRGALMALPSAAGPHCLSLLALLAGCSGAVLHVGFRDADLLPVAVLGIGCASALVSTLTGALLLGETARPLARLGALDAVVRPFRLFLGGGALAVVVGAASLVGFLRSGAIHGMALALFSLLWTSASRHLFPNGGRARYRDALPAYTAFAASASVLLLAERWVPIPELASQPGHVVFSESSAHARYVVSEYQAHFSLFVDGELRISGLDDYRYSEALVHPVLASAPARGRCLVIAAGDGGVARELVRYSDVTEITLVVPDLALPALARRSAWLKARQAGALDDPRVTLVEAEALPWLESGSDRYDVAIVDAPDPFRYAHGIHYTRYFYQALRRRLTPSGRAAIQATSTSRSERTRNIIGETLRSAGFSVLPYRAPVPALGEWGFFLAAEGPLTRPIGLPSTLELPLRFLNDETLRALFEEPTPTWEAPAEPSLLYRQTAVDVFREELETHTAL